jgi:uncharacterized membrane protein
MHHITRTHVNRRVSRRATLIGVLTGLLLGSCWLLSQAATVPEAPYVYEFLDLPITVETTDPSVLMIPQGINNRHMLTAQLWRAGGDSIIRATNGAITRVSCPDQVHMLLRGLNTLGQTVGACYTHVEGQAGYFSFLRDVAGRLVALRYPGAVYTEPMAINNVGQVVGWYYSESETDHPNPVGYYGFLWKNGHFQRLYGPQDHSVLLPMGINNQGAIVGGTYDDFDFATYLCTERPFLLAEGRFTFLDITPPSPALCHQTFARAVNDKGQVLLSAFATPYLWSQGQLSRLPGVPGFPHAEIYANGMNDHGEIVGWLVDLFVRDRDDNATYRAFVARPSMPQARAH